MREPNYYKRKKFPKLVATTVKISSEHKSEVDKRELNLSKLIRDLLDRWLQESGKK